MALLDFLKRKKENEKAKKPKKVSVTKESTKEGGSDKSPEGHFDGPAIMPTKRNLGGKSGSFSYSIIKEPHISEKATDLATDNNQYTFKVLNNANKIEIKKSVEGVYGVKVLAVNIIKIPPKKRRLGKTQGFKKGITKAVVKVKKGDKIEIL